MAEIFVENNNTQTEIDNTENTETQKYEEIESKLKIGLEKIDFNLNTDYKKEAKNIVNLLKKFNVDTNKIYINLFVEEIIKFYNGAQKDNSTLYETLIDSGITEKEIKNIYSKITSFIKEILPKKIDDEEDFEEFKEEDSVKLKEITNKALEKLLDDVKNISNIKDVALFDLEYETLKESINKGNIQPVIDIFNENISELDKKEKEVKEKIKENDNKIKYLKEKNKEIIDKIKKLTDKRWEITKELSLIIEKDIYYYEKVKKLKKILRKRNELKEGTKELNQLSKIEEKNIYLENNKESIFEYKKVLKDIKKDIKNLVGIGKNEKEKLSKEIDVNNITEYFLKNTYTLDKGFYTNKLDDTIEYKKNNQIFTINGTIKYYSKIITIFDGKVYDIIDGEIEGESKIFYLDGLEVKKTDDFKISDNLQKKYGVRNLKDAFIKMRKLNIIEYNKNYNKNYNLDNNVVLGNIDYHRQLGKIISKDINIIDVMQMLKNEQNIKLTLPEKNQFIMGLIEGSLEGKLFTKLIEINEFTGGKYKQEIKENIIMTMDGIGKKDFHINIDRIFPNKGYEMNFQDYLNRENLDKLIEANLLSEEQIYILEELN